MFTKMEKEFLKYFFDEVERKMGCAGCNDIEIPNTVEGRKFYKNCCKTMDKDYVEEFFKYVNPKAGGNFIGMDAIVFDHLRKKIEKIINQKE